MTQPENPLHRVRAALAEVLDEFRHDTHPGERCKQTGHVRVATIDRWRAVLAETAEAARQPDPQQVAAERDGAYRERAQLLAWLSVIVPAVIAPAPDVDEPGWQILFLTPAGTQLSWHIAPTDADLFDHVEHVHSRDPRAQWDGHTTPEKYDRIRGLTFDALRDGAEQARQDGHTGACPNPAAHVEVRDACPLCDGAPLFARRELAAHLRERHGGSGQNTPENATGARVSDEHPLAGGWQRPQGPNGPQAGAQPLDYPDAEANAEAENAWRQGEDHL